MFKSHGRVGEFMSVADNLNVRMNYLGKNPEERMNKGKLNSLKGAIKNSYQSETIRLSDGREFKCLINPNRLSADYDEKIISIPYSDICLTSGKEEEISIKQGEVFHWIEKKSDWLAYLEKIEEDAYFRAEIRKCKYKVMVNDQEYAVCVKVATPEDLQWRLRGNFMWNEMEDSLVMMITKDANTSAFFKRFATIKFDNNNWEVQAVNKYNLEGVIVVFLKETYNNDIKDVIDNLEKPEPLVSPIQGKYNIKPYDLCSYSIDAEVEGEWIVESRLVEIKSKDSRNVTIQVLTGRSGEFDLIYRPIDGEDIVVTITIDSL